MRDLRSRANFNPNSAQSIILFLVFFLLPTQLGKHFFFDFSYIYSLKIDYFALTFYLWDVLVLILFGFWFLSVNRKINQTALFVLLIFFLSQLISLFNATNLGAGLVRLEQYLIFSLLALYISSVNLEFVWSKLKWGLSLAVILEGVLATVEFISGSSVGLWILGERAFSLATPSIATFNWNGQVFLRPYGTFSHPNVLAGFLVLSLPVLAFNDRILPSFLTNISIGVGIVGGFLTFSRAAILVLITECFLYLKRRLKLFLFLLGVLVLLPIVFVRFASALNFDYISIIRREELAEIALKYFEENPLLGVGLNNFIVVSSSSSFISGASRFLQPVHNIYLLSLAETGIVGSIGFLVFLLFPLIRLITRSKNDRAKLLIQLYLIILFLGLFDHYFLTLPQGQRMLFVIWGLSLLV